MPLIEVKLSFLLPARCAEAMGQRLLEIRLEMDSSSEARLPRSTQHKWLRICCTSQSKAGLQNLCRVRSRGTSTRKTPGQESARTAAEMLGMMIGSALAAMTYRCHHSSRRIHMECRSGSQRPRTADGSNQRTSRRSMDLRRILVAGVEVKVVVKEAGAVVVVVAVEEAAVAPRARVVVATSEVAVR